MIELSQPSRSRWKTVRLGDIAKTTSGGTPRRDRPHFYGGNIPWVKSGELGDRVVYETAETITEEALKSSNAKVFPKGTLCIALYGATVGKLGILGIDAATNQAVCAVFPPKELDTRYLYRFFESKRRELVEQGKGGAQPNISQGIIRDTKIPLPPVPEQRRIVDEIEKQFTRLEAGVTALRRLQANLNRYRAAVLQAACEGRLVATEAAKWTKTTVADSVQIIDYRGRTPPFSESGIPHLRSQNIRHGRIVWRDLAFITSESYETFMTRGLPQDGDLLFTTEAPMGEVALAPDEKFSVAQRIMILRTASQFLDSRFLMLQLRSPEFQSRLRKSGTGSTVTGVSSRNFQPMTLLVPPLAEQKRIVAEVERRLSVSDALEGVVSANLQRANRLRQSILHNAFASGFA
jgi:type I restriction enzyme S subunit